VIVEGKIGYAKSDDSFTTPNYYLALGLSFDILSNLKGYTVVGFGAPGATLTDVHNRPVEDGKRPLSGMIEGGLKVAITDVVGLRGGILYQARGLTSGFNSPVHTTTSIVTGFDFTYLHTDWLKMSSGISVQVGTHQRGSMPSTTEFGAMLNLISMEFFNQQTVKR
jgi:hypothetical protein